MANEKRLIDANDAVEKLKKANQQLGVTMGDISVIGYNAVSVEAVMHFIKRCKTVDAVEVVHGRWVEADDGDGVICSVCREDFCTIIHETDRYNYCPNCGAKMDGDGNDTDC